MKYLSKIICGLIALLLVLLTSCNEDGSVAIGDARQSSSGLKAGLNYMQPLKWRMTYRYRVQEVIPKMKHYKPRPMGAGSTAKAVGTGTYEVWFAGPREGESVRNVKMVQAIPEPNSVAQGGNTDVELVYYDFSPNGQLPDQITATVSWEFVTMEAYTHWDGIARAEYDKSSELYIENTREEAPINFHPTLEKVSAEIYKEADGDPMQTALGCYNYVIQNFTYDYAQELWVTIAGLQALTDSYRSWENKHGVCDEFAMVFCAMMRSVGIPARPALGMSHGIMSVPAGNQEESAILTEYEKKYGPFLLAGGHAWAEFYLPEVGWIPVDPTWGQSQADEFITANYSKKGASRKIPHVDYYFGKNDPYRIPWFKDFNYTLVPEPKTPGADKSQEWMFAYTERTSGVHETVYGWPGAYGSGGG